MAIECPRCREVMLDEIEVGEIVLDRCPRCAGIWFDNSEMGAIAGRESKIHGIDSIVPRDAPFDESFNCPRCPGVALRRITCEVLDTRPSVFHRCVSCVGTWIDRGELRELEDPNLSSVLKQLFSKAK